MSAFLSRFIHAHQASKKAHQAEFNYRVVDGNYDFFAIRCNTDDPDHLGEEVSINEKDWPRCKWRVGIAQNRWVESLDIDKQAHWGVYIYRDDKAAPDGNFPPKTYKVYGTNWTQDPDEALQLESVWKTKRGLQRNMREDEIHFVLQGPDKEPESRTNVCQPHDMYFSWPEFVLAAQFVTQEYILWPMERGIAYLTPDDRNALTKSRNTPASYDLLRNNCQHFSKLFISLMINNQWGDPDRLREPFTLKDLSTEWMTMNNMWTKMSSNDRKQYLRRFFRVSPKLSEFDQHQLSPMSSEELGSESSNALRNKLGNCRLAISLAEAYNAAERQSNHDYPIEEYFEILEGDEVRDMMEDTEKVRKDMKEYMVKTLPEVEASVTAVVKTWFVSFHRILLQNKDAFDLLSFIAWINPQNIPKSLLPQSESLDTALETLQQYRLLECRSSNVFDMHGLLHSLTQMGIRRLDRHEATSLTAIQHVARIFPSGKNWDPAMFDQYKAHLRGVLFNKKLVMNEDTEETSDAEFLLGQGLRKGNNHVEAVDFLEEARQWRLHRLGEDHPKRLEAQLELTRAYLDNKAYKLGNRGPRQAILLLQRVNFKQLMARSPDTHSSSPLPQNVLLLVFELRLEQARAYSMEKDRRQAIELLVELKHAEPNGFVDQYPQWAVYQRRREKELIDAYDADSSPKRLIKEIKDILGPGGSSDRLVLREDLVFTLGDTYHRNNNFKEERELYENLKSARSDGGKSYSIDEQIGLLEKLRDAWCADSSEAAETMVKDIQLELQRLFKLRASMGV